MPIVNPIWFWLADFLNSLKFVSTLACILCVAGMTLCLLTASDKFLEDDSKYWCTVAKKFVVAAIIFGVTWILVPSYTTVKEMAVASVTTYENVEAVKGEVTDLVDYIIDSVGKLNDAD